MHKQSALLAATAAVSALTLSACAAPSAPEGPRELTIAVQWVGLSDPLNYGNLIFLLGQEFYEPLISWDQRDNSFVPWLAEDYELSDDGMAMDLTLRSEVSFADGVHMDAAGVSTYLNTYMETDTALFAGLLNDRYGMTVEATGEYTLRFTTTAPMRQHWFETIVMIPIASPVAIEDPAALAETPAGTGAYVLDELVPDVSLTMTRNPDYWNADLFPFDRITYQVFSDEVAALNALKSGQIDATALDTTLAVEAEREGFALHAGSGQYATLVTIDRDSPLAPALGDLRVRQALNMAFDQKTITEVLEQGYGTTGSQPFAPAQGTYIEGADDRYPYDPERARELLAEAGYPDGFDIVIPSFGGTVQYDPKYEPIVQQSLAEIGVRVTFEQYPDEPAVNAAIAAGKYPLLLLVMFNVNTLSYPLESSCVAFGLCKMIDEPARELFDAVTSGPQAELADAEQELGEYILDQAWFAPFSHPATLWATVPEVTTVVGDINGFLRLSDFDVVAP